MAKTTRPRLTRAQKVNRTRQALLDAAMNVVGEFGMAEASIANITRAADVALGTFYMHFESKQALLEQLLPWAGQNAHAHMEKVVAEARNYADYEVRNFDALVDFQRAHPYYFRLLSEAEVATPDQYHQHVDRSINRYRDALHKAHARGELPQYAEADLEVLATMLVSIKLLVFTRFGSSKDRTAQMRRVYLTFVLNGLFGSPLQGGAAPSPRTTKVQDRVHKAAAKTAR